MRYEVYQSVGEVTRIKEYEGEATEIALLMKLIDDEETEIPVKKLEITPEQERAFKTNTLVDQSFREKLIHLLTTDSPSSAPLRELEPEDFIALLKGFYVVKKEDQTGKIIPDFRQG